MNSSTTATGPYAYAPTMAAGSSAGRDTLLAPSADPLRDGLTIIGKPICSPSAATRAGAPSSRKISCGRATCRGARTPASATTRVQTDLSNATRQAAPVDPTNGTSSSASTSRSAPSSPASPCSTGKTTAPGCSASRRADRSRRRTRPRRTLPAQRLGHRRPDRSDTSRSCDSPPASTTTVSTYAASSCLVSGFGAGPLLASRFGRGRAARSRPGRQRGAEGLHHARPRSAAPRPAAGCPR